VGNQITHTVEVKELDTVLLGLLLSVLVDHTEVESLGMHN